MNTENQDETITDADLPFAHDLISETERRWRKSAQKDKVSTRALGDGPAGPINDSEAVNRRLKRMGISIEQLREDSPDTPTASRGFNTSSRALIDDTALIEERILGRNELMSIAFLEGGSAKARSVGRIVTRTSGGRSSYGTGFIIWPSLVMTNNHVLRNEAMASASRIQFNYQDDAFGKRQAPVEFELDPDRFFSTNKALDFTLVAVSLKDVDGVHELSEFGWNRLNNEPGEILVGESVNIIQHPNGEPKQLAFRDNHVTGMPEGSFLQYKADTLPGSSGSPVFNDQWELIALHHSGVPNRNDEGKILAIDGTVWKSTMGEHKVDWIANEGIRISAIYGALRDVDSEIVEQALRVPNGPDQLIEAVGSTLPETDASGGIGLQSLVEDKPQTTNPRTQSVTIELPLKVTLNMDENQKYSVASISSTITDSGGRTPVASTDDGADEEETVCVDQDYSNRKGYIPGFLGNGPRHVRLPGLSPALEKIAAVNQEAKRKDPYVLPYHNYSVVMNKKRKLAIFAAVNIDGKKIKKVTRDRDRWYFDPRISRSEQCGAEVYKRNPLDKGHLVRRLDSAWGDSDEIARIGSDDTFHYTNCAPQHADFNRNRSTWAGVENYIFKHTNVEDLKVSVFNGPVFDEGDPPYRGINLPTQFWKVVVMVKKDKSLSATGYLLSQEKLVQGIEEEFTFGEYQTFQVPVSRIEAMTGLDFHNLSEHDPLASASPGAQEISEQRSIETFEDIVI